MCQKVLLFVHKSWLRYYFFIHLAAFITSQKTYARYLYKLYNFSILLFQITPFWYYILFFTNNNKPFKVAVYNFLDKLLDGLCLLVLQHTFFFYLWHKFIFQKYYNYTHYWTFNMLLEINRSFRFIIWYFSIIYLRLLDFVTPYYYDEDFHYQRKFDVLQQILKGPLLRISL